MKLVKISFILASLFLGFSANALLSYERLKFIRSVANSVSTTKMFGAMSVLEDRNFPGPAASQKINQNSFMMKINPTIMETLSTPAQQFIKYHEAGHFYLGHLDSPYIDSVAYRTQIELEADAFAAFFYKRNNHLSQDFFRFIYVIRTKTQTVPPGPMRASLIEAIIRAN
jgi:hypothetical protein